MVDTRQLYREVAERRRQVPRKMLEQGGPGLEAEPRAAGVEAGPDRPLKPQPPSFAAFV